MAIPAGGAIRLDDGSAALWTVAGNHSKTRHAIRANRRLIFACAQIHGLGVAHDDTHFDELAKLEA